LPTAAKKKLKITLDRNSAVPLYRQLADELKYQIATGAIKVGDRLPPIAVAATQWKINLHTVRHAYKQLSEMGIAELTRSRGTIVTSRSHVPVEGSGLEAFLTWVASHGRQEFGLRREDIAELLTATSATSGRKDGHVALSFVECSEAQAGDHAREIAKTFDVEIEGWSLSGKSEPPPGPIVATYFHFNDIRKRWPHRMRDAEFVAIQPSHALRRRLSKALRDCSATRVFLVEREETMARAISGDIAGFLPKVMPQLETKVARSFGQIRLSNQAIYLFSPRGWSQLPEHMQDAPNTVAITYAVPKEEMARLGLLMHWAPRT